MTEMVSKQLHEPCHLGDQTRVSGGARRATRICCARDALQNVASTASVANSSIDADSRSERSERARRTARLIASLTIGCPYSCVMSVFLLHQSHRNQADGSSFTWEYSAVSARGVIASSGHLQDIKTGARCSLLPMSPSAARLSVAINLPSVHSVETR
jgi:hypothetical protein